MITSSCIINECVTRFAYKSITIHSWIICVLFSGIANFHEVQDYSRRRSILWRGREQSLFYNPRELSVLQARETVRVYPCVLDARAYVCVCVCVSGIHTTMFAYGTGTQFPGGKFACTLRNQACTFLYNLAHVACPTSRVTIEGISILRTVSTRTRSRTSPLYVEILRQRSRNISP